MESEEKKLQSGILLILFFFSLRKVESVGKKQSENPRGHVMKAQFVCGEN